MAFLGVCLLRIFFRASLHVYICIMSIKIFELCVYGQIAHHK